MQIRPTDPTNLRSVCPLGVFSRVTRLHLSERPVLTTLGLLAGVRTRRFDDCDRHRMWDIGRRSRGGTTESMARRAAQPLESTVADPVGRRPFRTRRSQLPLSDTARARRSQRCRMCRLGNDDTHRSTECATHHPRRSHHSANPNAAEQSLPRRLRNAWSRRRRVLQATRSARRCDRFRGGEVTRQR